MNFCFIHFSTTSQAWLYSKLIFVYNYLDLVWAERENKRPPLLQMVDFIGPGAGILLVFFLVACCFRMLSGREYRRVVSVTGDSKTVATIPYWIPFFGHLLSLMVDPERLLKVSRYVSHALRNPSSKLDTE